MLDEIAPFLPAVLGLIALSVLLWLGTAIYSRRLLRKGRVKSLRAVVLSKEADGSAYRATFLPRGKAAITLELPREDFITLTEGTKGTLQTQEGAFLRFVR